MTPRPPAKPRTSGGSTRPSEARPTTREERRSAKALEKVVGSSPGRPARAARPATRAAAPQARERRRNGALLGAMVTSIACVGVLFVGPFPVRTWWSQHTEAERLQQQIDVLHKANGKLSTRSRELDDPATIAALARRDYGMVRKGESAYAILPPPVPANRLPAVWPFVPLTDSSSGTH